MRGADQEAAVIHGLRLHEGGGARLQGDGGCCSFVSGTASGGLSSSTTSSLTDDSDDDDAASSPPGRRPVSSSSSSSSSSSLTSSSDKMQTTDGAAASGPLYELSTMMDHLPALRTGLSKYYRGRSQSFTSLAKVSCAEDLAKKTTPCLRSTSKASRCYSAVLGAKNRWSKKVTKKRCRGVHLTTYCRKPGGAQASCPVQQRQITYKTMARERCTDASSW